MDESALEVSGIIRLHNQPTLGLKGQGVLIGFLDSGIDYESQVFRNSDGSTRIMAIWDQTERRPMVLSMAANIKTIRLIAH